LTVPTTQGLYGWIYGIAAICLRKKRAETGSATRRFQHQQESEQVRACPIVPPERLFFFDSCNKHKASFVSICEDNA